MQNQFQHHLTTSFALWFDNYLLRKGEAYTNQTGQFFSYTDQRISSSYNIFGSAYKQFVTDSSITGATIPTGIYANSVEQTSSGVILDFGNGRILSTGIAPTATVTGSFSVKDFNIYFTNEGEEDLLIERKYNSRSSYPTTNTNIDPYDQSIPAVFINTESIKNEPFAFGGMDRTMTSVKAVVISDTPYLLDGILSIFADSRNEAFSIIPASAHPIDEYGDLKSPPYNYTSLAASYNDSKFYIDYVQASKMSDKAQSALPSNMYIGFLDFDIYTHRFPRQ